MNLLFSLKTKLKGSPCEVFNADQRVHIQQNTLFTYPDLSIICGEPEYYNNDSLNLTNPAVIVEVLSPSTKNYDRLGETLQIATVGVGLQLADIYEKARFLKVTP